MLSRQAVRALISATNGVEKMMKVQRPKTDQVFEKKAQKLNSRDFQEQQDNKFTISQ